MGKRRHSFYFVKMTSAKEGCYDIHVLINKMTYMATTRIFRVEKHFVRYCMFKQMNVNASLT